MMIFPYGRLMLPCEMLMVPAADEQEQAGGLQYCKYSKDIGDR